MRKKKKKKKRRMLNGLHGMLSGKTAIHRRGTRGNIRGMASAMRSAVQINAQKARDLYRGSQAVVKATPLVMF